MSVNGCAWRPKGCACETQKARATLEGSLTVVCMHNAPQNHDDKSPNRTRALSCVA
jgi:hypothetical protein